MSYYDESTDSHHNAFCTGCHQPCVEDTKNDSWRLLKQLRNPDRIFDLLIAMSFMRGGTNGMVPVEESRDVFGHIKKLLAKANK